MEGFGYTLTGASAMVIHRMPPAARAALLRELFGRGSDALGISVLRLSIGASDLSAYPYTYDEVPDGESDPTLARFTIVEERTHLLPLLREILAIAPHLTIIATPWTAPRWMKDNGSYVGGSLRREHFPAYARYVVKYIEAMRAEGVTVHAVTPQNEPLHPGNEPSMLMTAVDQAEFVGRHLGPALRAAGLATRIIVYDHNADHPEYAITVLNDSAAKAYADGAAFHLYGGTIDALQRVRDAHPDRHLYFTEQYTGARGDFGGDLRWHVRNVLTGAPTYWCRMVLEWNLASDETFGPHTPGGCSDCLGALTIDSRTHGVTRNVSYYIIGHASRFVPRGSVRVRSFAEGPAAGLVHVAFRTPAGQTVLVAMNDGEAVRTFRVRVAGRAVTHTLPVGGVATYVW
jgi:glucosylceramidase